MKLKGLSDKAISRIARIVVGQEEEDTGFGVYEDDESEEESEEISKPEVKLEEPELQPEPEGTTEIKEPKKKELVRYSLYGDATLDDGRSMTIRRHRINLPDVTLSKLKSKLRSYHNQGWGINGTIRCTKYPDSKVQVERSGLRGRSAGALGNLSAAEWEDLFRSGSAG